MVRGGPLGDLIDFEATYEIDIFNLILYLRFVYYGRVLFEQLIPAYTLDFFLKIFQKKTL